MANEKRLIKVIDATAVYNGIALYMAENAYLNDTALDVLKMMAGWLNEAPTVDAVEVVHGKWEDEHGGKYANPRYRCSACKERALYKFERDLLDNWKEVQAFTPNCPYCGAMMDLED